MLSAPIEAAYPLYYSPESRPDSTTVAAPPRRRFVTHDLLPEGSDREKNGLTVAEYSTSEGVITIDRIIVDSVSKDPEDPVFSAGESFGYSFDSNAVLVFLELEDDEEIPTYRVLSEQERNSGLF